MALNKLVLVLSCLALGGCGSFRSGLPPASPIVPASASAGVSLIAQDFVNVIAQIDRLPAGLTSLSFPASATRSDEFAQALKLAFERAGYAVRSVGVGQFDIPVSYQAASSSMDSVGLITRYTVSLGDISIRRGYTDIQGSNVKPVAAMQIRGVNARTLQLDDSLFDTQSDTVAGELSVQGPALKPFVLASTNERPAPATQAIVDSEPVAVEQPVVANPPVVVEPAAVAAVQEPIAKAPVAVASNQQGASRSLLDIAAPSVAKVPRESSEFGIAQRLATLPTRNVRELGQSNFAGLLDDYAIVEETVLTFDNDSKRLGDFNKNKVRRFVARFDPDVDVFSVIGCSNGPTAVTEGQKGLALGRANRVSEELRFAGVPANSILQEGCWADEAFDNRMPRRGVVLTLKRKVTS